MRTSVFVTLACLLGLPAMASAAHILASAPTFGATTQHAAQCILGNTGTKDITVNATIVDESGNALPVATTCNEPIPPHFSCTVFANSIPSSAAVACSVTVSGSGNKLRGSLSILDSNEVPLRSAELR